MHYDLVFITETWLEEVDDSRSYFIHSHSHVNIYEVKATRDHQTGRPSGGICIIVNNKFKSKFYKISNRITLTKIKGE